MSLTRSDYYGAGRNADYRAIKERNWNGRVLQKGDYNAETEELKSHYKSAHDNVFGRCQTGVKQDQYTIKQKHAGVDKSAFGLKKGFFTYDQSSKDYGNTKWNSWDFKPSKAVVDREIHLVDFSPKYNKGKFKGLSSIYRYSYNQPKIPSNSRLHEVKTDRLTLPAAHFNLGTTKEKASTETTDSFKEYAEEEYHTPSSVERFNYRSNIFKRGDWNIAEPTIANESVTTKDFEASNQCGNSAFKHSFGRTVKKNFKDLPDYAKTHLNIFPRNKHNSPFLKREYLVGIGGAIQKPRIFKAPPSSSVIQRDGSPVKSSMNKEDYVSYQDKLKDLDRSAESLQNKINFAENHIKAVQEMRSLSPEKYCTNTRTHYWKPSSDAMTLEHMKAPRPKYRLLGSDEETSKPEAKENVATHLMIKKDNEKPVRHIRKKRQSDKSGTVICLGYDELGRSTEHDTRFRSPIMMDPKAVAAGVTRKTTNKLTKTREQSEGEHIAPETKQPMTSVTRDDYKPIDTQRFTGPQKRYFYELGKYPRKTGPSHLFHLDSTSHFASRTKTDFTAPFN